MYSKQNDRENSAIYFIAEGDVDLFYQDSSRQTRSEILLKELRKGSFFGELSFFVETPCEFTARSRTFSTVYKVLKDDFTKFCENHPNDYVNY